MLLQVIQLIPTKDPPRLDPKVYSADFCHFVSKCLIKNPNDRPSIKDLLKHSFVTSAGSNSLLVAAGQEAKGELKYERRTE